MAPPPDAGLEAIAGIEHPDRLARYPFFPAAIGELELRLGRAQDAREHFREALRLARNDAERRYLKRRIAACDGAVAR
jgi:RNA polymerase sigma-70 factor (ECF subfamily)